MSRTCNRGRASEYQDMTASENTLKRLLASDLPLDRVGPHLRHACRRALHSGDLERMKLAAKVVIDDLARRGELLSVSIEGGTGDQAGPGPFCMVKGTRKVLDLSFLGRTTRRFKAPKPVPNPVAKKLPVPVATPAGLDSLAGMLGAMEQAQDLAIGDPRSGEMGVILVSILQLLERFMPQFPMFIMLHSRDAVPEGQELMFATDPAEAGGGWLSVRTPGHSVWIPNPEELPGHILKNLTGSSDPSNHRSTVAVPLWKPGSNGRDISSAQESGLLFLVSPDNLGRDATLRMAERLSRFVSRRWRHQREVNQRIHVDGLTGAFNRAFFDSQFTLELERARRSEVPLTLVIADLDKFKRTNDTYGHPGGDAVLRMVARRLQEELRRIDHICRIGGEEFALILPDTSQEAAQEVLGRLLDSRFQTEFAYEGKTIEISVTFSYGAVTFPAAGSDPFELYRKADGMLFLSKDLGRNRCHFWSSEGDHIQLLPTDRGD
jgi:diguanylate cyclase (GGDEF)-like protein